MVPSGWTWKSRPALTSCSVSGQPVVHQGAFSWARRACCVQKAPHLKEQGCSIQVRASRVQQARLLGRQGPASAACARQGATRMCLAALVVPCVPQARSSLSRALPTVLPAPPDRSRIILGTLHARPVRPVPRRPWPARLPVCRVLSYPINSVARGIQPALLAGLRPHSPP